MLIVIIFFCSASIQSNNDQSEGMEVRDGGEEANRKEDETIIEEEQIYEGESTGSN